MLPPQHQMNEFQSEPGPEDADDADATAAAPQVKHHTPGRSISSPSPSCFWISRSDGHSGLNLCVCAEPHQGGGSSAEASATPLPRPSRRVDTLNHDDSSSDRHSRRHQSSGAVSGDNPRLRDTSEESKHGRRHRSSAGIVGAEQTAPDLPTVPKQPRRRKAKGSSSTAGGSSGTTKSSRSKAVIPSESGSEEQRSEPIAPPVLKPTMEEEKENEEEGVGEEKKATGALHSFDAASIWIRL